MPYSTQPVATGARERCLRAQLIVALALGVVTLRATADLSPLTSASADELVGPLDDTVRALLGPAPNRSREPR